MSWLREVKDKDTLVLVEDLRDRVFRTANARQVELEIVGDPRKDSSIRVLGDPRWGNDSSKNHRKYVRREQQWRKSKKKVVLITLAHRNQYFDDLLKPEGWRE